MMTAAAKSKNMGDSHLLIEILHRHFDGRGGMVHNRAIEIGVHRGATSALLLAAFPSLTLTMVDPWAVYSTDHPYRKSGDGCAKLDAFEQADNFSTAREAVAFAGVRAKIERRTSMQVAQKWRYRDGGRKGYKLDFAFLDGDHTYEAVKKDIESWWPYVASGGVLCGHDYGHTRCKKGLWGVDRAVDEFAEREGLPLTVAGSIWSAGRP